VELEFTHRASGFWGVTFPKERAGGSVAAFVSEVPAQPSPEPYVEARPPAPLKAAAAAAAAAAEVNVAASSAAPAVVTPIAAEITTAVLPIAVPTQPESPEPANPAAPESFSFPRPAAISLPHAGMANVVDRDPVATQLMKWDSFGAPAPRRGRMRLATAIATALFSAGLLGYRLFSTEEAQIAPVLQQSSLVAGDGVRQLAAAASSSASSAHLTGAEKGAAPASIAPASPSGDGPVPTVVTVTAAAPDIAAAQAPRRLDILISKMTMPVRSTPSDPRNSPDQPAGEVELAPPSVPQLNNSGVPGAPAGILGAMRPKLPPPPPTPAPESARRAADPLIPARLVSSVRPVYPAMARQSRLEGNVTIEAQIDAAGKVSGMKVLSGPMMFQQAAMEAVARWKYEPARRKDEAIPSSVVVTLQFRLN
jgi:protein TonB